MAIHKFINSSENELTEIRTVSLLLEYHLWARCDIVSDTWYPLFHFYGVCLTLRTPTALPEHPSSAPVLSTPFKQNHSTVACNNFWTCSSSNKIPYTMGTTPCRSTLLRKLSHRYSIHFHLRFYFLCLTCSISGASAVENFRLDEKSNKKSLL